MIGEDVGNNYKGVSLKPRFIAQSFSLEHYSVTKRSPLVVPPHVIYTILQQCVHSLFRPKSNISALHQVQFTFELFTLADGRQAFDKRHNKLASIT